MSFGTYARKVRDADQPFGRRVWALRSCVQLYGPIGFNNSLSFLEEVAGRFRTDEVALLRALDALVASRAQWHVAVAAYAQGRREAKQRGERSPRPADFNPNHVDRWYGDVQRAALHVMRNEQAEFRRLGGAVGPQGLEAAMSELLDASLTAEGQLSADQSIALNEVVASLQARLTQDLYREDAPAYSYCQRLLRIANLMKAALGSDPVSS